MRSHSRSLALTHFYTVVIFDSLKKMVCIILTTSHISVDDIQVACYKILNALYSLGTGRGAFVER